MNYTENYQLPQWVKSDRVLMTDFNSANSKIDTALKSLSEKSAWTKLASLTTTSAAHSISLSVPTGKIVQQQIILIRASVSLYRAYLTVNNQGSRYPLTTSGSWESNGMLELNTDKPGWLMIPIAKNGSGQMCGLALGLNLCYATCSIAPANWSTMELTNIYSDRDLPAGATMELWGCY